MVVTRKLIGGCLSVNRYSRHRCKDCTKCNNQDIAWFDTCYTLNTYNANYAIRLFRPRPLLQNWKQRQFKCCTQSRSNKMKIKLKAHPKLKVAHEFVTNHPEVVIAGGVARDILLGKEYDDVDMFAGLGSNMKDIAKQILALKKACNDLDLELHLAPAAYDFNARFNAGNLNICLLTQEIMSTTEKMVTSFDMVMSQAWLVPTKSGFEVKATDLFHQLNDHKILGYYPDIVHRESEHVARIADKYPEHLLLELTRQQLTLDDSIPF